MSCFTESEENRAYEEEKAGKINEAVATSSLCSSEVHNDRSRSGGGAGGGGKGIARGVAERPAAAKAVAAVTSVMVTTVEIARLW